MAVEQQNLLQDLRDIHYPDPISIWPLAIGWYVLIALVVIGSLLLGLFAYRFWHKLKKRKFILKQLNHLEILAEKNLSGAQSLAELSMLLKRVALACHARKEVAGLTGEAWLDFLDRQGATTEFTQGIGKMLLHAPYQAETNADIKPLFHLAKQWIKRQF